MRQYYDIKKKYPGALLLFRVGDFYETFEKDAVLASEVLGITLTKRANGVASEVALAGFPHHSLDVYLPKLVRAGHRVAVCDQLEDPKLAKKIVKRGVTELVTPGVAANDHVLQQNSNNFLCAVHIEKERAGVALLDFSTGEFYFSEGDKGMIERLIQAKKPNEIIYNKSDVDIQGWLGDKYYTFPLDAWLFDASFAGDLLLNHYKVSSLKGFGMDETSLGCIAAGVVVHYLKQTEHRHLKHILQPSRIDIEDYVRLDKFTIRNLELIYADRQEATTLYDVMNQTLTPIGARLLRKWITMPLKDKKAIQERLDIVGCLMNEPDLANSLTQQLTRLGDLERLIAKIGQKKIGPREMNYLKEAMRKTASVKEILEQQQHPFLLSKAEIINPCHSVIDRIDKEIHEDAPISFQKKGVFIKEGVSEELDELRKIAYGGKDYLARLQKNESERTGITSLKIGFNNVFGYYLEVTHAHKNKVPSEWIRKQTLVNAERYITPELKEYEDKILTAEEKIALLEQSLFNRLVAYLEAYIRTIQINAHVLAQMDVLLCFARLSRENNYVKPAFCEDNMLEIENGRHPVIEKTMPYGESYVPNSLNLNSEEQQIIIITGPNMSGKSAFLRQTALIVLMAQTGCFVPADKLRMKPVDKIFTRVGANDNMSQGESTFMVEMNETASILNNCTEHSLILLDEIGRGTSTFDGISIAWAIAEYLHDRAGNRPKTLFSTHYHELNELEGRYARIKNFHFSVKEAGGQVHFMRKLLPGGSEHSFGIHVADRAGVPRWIIDKAKQILQGLEESRAGQTGSTLPDKPPSDVQMQLFAVDESKWEEVKNAFSALDPNALTPLEALMKLSELKRWIEKQ